MNKMTNFINVNLEDILWKVLAVVPRRGRKILAECGYYNRSRKGQRRWENGGRQKAAKLLAKAVFAANGQKHMFLTSSNDGSFTFRHWMDREEA